MEGEHQHEHDAPPVIAPVIEASDELTQPVIDHAEKIVRIEERQSQHQQDMLRQLADLEGRLVTATGSQVGALEDRISKLEGKLAAQAESVGVPDESVELSLPEVEASPEPPEKIRQGMRHRRKGKRGKS